MRRDGHTKQCSKCREHKPVGEFHSNKSQPDGISHYCKTCIRKHNADRWRNCPGYQERNAKWQKARRDRDIAAARSKQAAYLRDNPDKLKAWQDNVRDHLTDAYIRRVLRYRGFTEYPSAAIEAVRALLVLKRGLRTGVFVDIAESHRLVGDLKRTIHAYHKRRA